MDVITNAVLLKEASTRGQVAMVYGLAGLLVGVLFLSKK